ncbi:hypothetical protein BG006_007621 [Podila minutissima]|uniref:XPG-I domain-containing protein n=1 Tax=Podila minutissima TaxID=64525 RepID=A0A9P5SUU4_9FUNG|nr:hypothetical protein BG006_007621 [Podila minutissima]
MGFQGWNAFLARFDVWGTPLNPRSQPKHTHLDLMGTYYYLIRAIYKSVPNRDARHITKILMRKLSAAFTAENTTIHLDGLPSVEKADEHLRRYHIKANALVRASALVDHCEAAAVRGESLERASATALKLIGDCRSIPKPVGERILANLEKKGWKVCYCRGEADVCIAGQPDIEHCAVVSADSDLFLHSRVQELVRPNPDNKKQFLVYHKDDLLERMGLSESQLMVLAVVSRSDYTVNVRGYGLARNHKLLRTLSPLLPHSSRSISNRKQKSHWERVIEESESILDQYFEHVDADEDQFMNAINIFWYQQETLLPKRRAGFQRRSFNPDAWALEARLQNARDTVEVSRAEPELEASMASLTLGESSNQPRRFHRDKKQDGAPRRRREDLSRI